MIKLLVEKYFGDICISYGAMIREMNVCNILIFTTTCFPLTDDDDESDNMIEKDSNRNIGITTDVLSSDTNTMKEWDGDKASIVLRTIKNLTQMTMMAVIVQGRQMTAVV